MISGSLGHDGMPKQFMLSGMRLLALREAMPASATIATSDEELERKLASLTAAAQRAWPGVTVDEGEFLRYLGARIPEEASLPAVLDELHTGDLYLACACAAGEPAAASAFRRCIVDNLDQAVVPAAADRLDEVRQLLVEKMLVSAEGPPRITGYRGRGALHAWARVSAARIALTLSRSKSRPEVLADLTLDAVSPLPSPEMAHLKATYRAELKQSIESATASLSVRERNLLRHSLLDGLTIDDLAELYGVHRATTARWVTAAREALAAATKRDLCNRLGLKKSELDSLYQLVDSQFELSWGAFRR
jgi:RNA polymerase sigma-70 factor (ECF subfamily)